MSFYLNEFVSYNDIKKKIKVPTIFSNQLAEFIGFHLGDGHYNLHKKYNYYFFYGGEPKSERDYYNKIPDYIKNNKEDIKSSFLRGIFDAEGSFKIKKGKYVYPRINICMKNKKFMYHLKEMIWSFNIKSSIYEYKNIDKRTKKLHVRYNLTINGYNECEKWIRTIGTNNEKHKLRIKKVYSNFFK